VERAAGANGEAFSVQRADAGRNRQLTLAVDEILTTDANGLERPAEPRRLRLAPDPKAGAELPVVSLFTGAGGLDLGLARAAADQFSFRACVEIDRAARDTLRANWADLRETRAGLFSDITEVSPKRLMSVTDLAPGETFLLAGGPPCQSFSSAGLRQSVNDASGRVVHDYFEMVRQLRPRFFVFENVRGLLSAAIRHRPLVDRAHPQEVADDEDQRLGSVLNKIVLATFKRLGYEVVYGLLNAADYGTAQVRFRLFVLGSRDREFGSASFRKQTSRPMAPLDLMPPTHHRLAAYAPIAKWRTMREAIGHLAEDPPDPDDAYTYSSERASVFRQIPPGRNWTFVRDHPERFPPGFLEAIMGKGLSSGGGKEGYWRRLTWDRPAPTLTAQPQQLATSLCHPDFERPLSIPEYAALQDFPPDYEFVGPKANRYRQIGNAVPVRLAEALGRVLLRVAE
jgi:DNA (cytosine-5)-methyltransferase 1